MKLIRAWHLICLFFVAIAKALTLAHALELPGKMLLDRDTYLAVQKIYYPGFTIGGAAEPLGIIALLLLLYLAPPEGNRYWWALTAFGALVAMHLIYWFVTHPVNNFWTRDIKLEGVGVTFFSLLAPKLNGDDWMRLRVVWEYSHAARAVLGMISFVCLARAIVA
jgi:hypothetical protein